MAITWPAFLQQKLNQAGFSQDPQDNVLRSQTSTGPAKLRPRTTKRVDPYSATITIDITEFQLWDNFYTIDLNNGTSQFVFNHPYTQVPSNWRFTKPYKTSPIGGTTLNITLEWELMP